MADAVDGLANNNDLRKRIVFTVLMMAVFRFGVHVPTPGVDGSTVLKFFSNQGGVFGLFNTFTGGALNQFSVFALGIMPYISSSIIFQLLTAVVPYFEELKKEGQMGQKKITQWTRYGTVALAVVQGVAISSWLMREGYEGHPLVTSAFVGFVPFQLMTVLTLTAGSCFVMWIGEQVTDRGVGNGSSLIIFAGIAAGIPKGATSMYTLLKNGEMSGLIAVGLLVLMVVVIAAIIFLEVGQRRIPIHFSNKGGRIPGVAQASHLPLKINLSGVMPPIFASSLLLFPATLTQFVKAPWLTQIKDSLSPTGGIYTILFIGLLVFFCFFYTEIVMNPVEVADNLKKGGKFIPGIRAGVSTSQYIQRVMDRLNVGGAIYLSAICVLPGQLIDKFNIPFYFGGTSLLILVGVALDTTQQIQSHLLTQKYDAFMKGSKIRGRRVTF